MGKELLETVISSLMDMGLLVYLYKDYEKKESYKFKIVLSTLIYIIAVICRGLFYLDYNVIHMIIISFVLGINGYLMFFVPNFVHYIKQTIIMIVSVNAADTLAVISIFIFQNNNNIAFLEDFWFWILFLSVSRGINFIIIFCVHKFKFSSSEKKNKKEQWITGMIFIGLYLYILYLALIIFSERYKIKDFLLLLFIATILVTIVAIGFFVMGKQKEERTLVKKELELLKQKNQYQMQSYQEKREVEVELKKMYHDIKNLELLVSAYKEKGMNTEEVDIYIGKMKEYFTPADCISTGNEILDIFLRENQKECKEKGILLTCNVDFTKGNFIHVVDIGTIFGNILDNAKEACVKIEETKKRKVNLQVRNYEKFLIIECSNPVLEIKKEKGRLLTTKKDKFNHGLGLVCLNEVLKSYNGEFSYEIKNGEFSITIVIPIVEISSK